MSDFYKEIAPLHLSKYNLEFFHQLRKCEGVMTSSHIHPAIEFIYISDGSFEIGIGNDTVYASVGDLILFRSNIIHTIKNIAEGEGGYYVLKINPTLLFQIFLGNDTNRCVFPFIHKSEGDVSYFPAADIPEEVLKILKDMISEYKHADSFFYAIERSFAASFLVSILRNHLIKPSSSEGEDISEKSVALIHKSVQYINDNYASDITPAQCADNIHLSYSYFAKLFRAVMGKTFKEYLTGVRLAKAHSILISTSLSITDVAASCGYSNLSYFISEYRKTYGKTPRETRKNNPLKCSRYRNE